MTNNSRTPADRRGLGSPATGLGTSIRVLYLLNVSNPQQLSADSGFTFASLLTPAMVEAGAHVTMAAPVAAGDTRVSFAPTQSPKTKYRARFDPDMDQLVELIEKTRPDVVVANQLEAAPAVRAALLEAGSEAIIAGYCHYLPFSMGDGGEPTLDPSLDDAGLGRPVLLTFVAGLAACDRVLVHSSTAASWTAQAAERMGVDVTDRLRIVPAPRDERLVQDPALRSAPGGEAIGLYNHRLYEHYGTGKFSVLARRLVAEESVLQLRVMDLFGKRSPERIQLDPSPEVYTEELAVLPRVTIEYDGGDRSRYRALLASSHFGIAPFRPGCPWSMSVIDCQAMGMPVIAPRTGWLAEHIHPDLLFDTVDEAVGIAARLATDKEFYSLHSKQAHESTADLAPAVVAARYLEAVL
ncbi:glycosyltransferase family 1 protein [Streptomyces shenzhenensis]|uniref:glycosyltransferase family 1 protein n=1 Tax=Streptomyces shenzhenensis TaxID=943815 RepID=UPI003D9035E0